MVPYGQGAAGGPPESPAERASAQRTAMLCAGGWSVPFLLAMLIGVDVVAGVARTHYVSQAVGGGGYRYRPPPSYGWYALLPGLACWAGCAVAELLLARRLAGAYPALGPWAWIRSSSIRRRVRGVLSGVDRRLSGAGGCAALIAVALVGPLVVLVWMVATAAAVPLWVVVLLTFTTVYLLGWRRRGAA